MKKILYLFLTVSLIFSSCSKEDEAVTPTVITGCMDNTADNYNSNANEEASNSCNFSAEVTYFLYKSASDAMIASGIPYVGFYDNFDNLMGTISYQYYYNFMSNVPCATTDGTLNSGIVWTGNSSTNGANFVYHIYLNDGSYFATGNFDVNAGECKLVGFVVTKSMAEEMLNR
jgi:hypothetical protein